MTINENNPERLTITTQQVREMTGLGKTTIYELINGGKLKRAKVPGVRRTLIYYASLTALIKGDDESPPA